MQHQTRLRRQKTTNRMNENIPTPKEFQVDDLRYKTLTDTEVCVVGLVHPEQIALTIPAHIDHDGHTYMVTQISEKAFWTCTDLTAITIPASVTEIGYYALWGCSALTSIIVDPKNTVYDSREHCNALIHTATQTLIAGCQQTLIPQDVTKIEAGAFAECLGLKSIKIPKGVTCIGDWAFHGCLSLAAVSLPKTLKVIGDWAFHDCLSLSRVELPYGVREIGDFAFWGCTALKSMDIPKTVTYLGEDAVPEDASERR